MIANQSPSDSGQISFQNELIRKATHMGALVIPAGYYLLQLDRSTMLALMVPITCLMILIDISRLRRWAFWNRFASRLISPIVRGHENAGDFTGATYILTTVCLTVALYDKPIVIAALAFIIVGDTLAALIGRKFGRHKWFRGKSIEGSVACLVGCLIVALMVPDIALYVSLLGAVVAAFVEALPLGIDDNVTVPILSGLAMTLADKIILTF